MNAGRIGSFIGYINLYSATRGRIKRKEKKHNNSQNINMGLEMTDP